LMLISFHVLNSFHLHLLRKNIFYTYCHYDHLCGPVVRVSGYRSRFPALPDFLRSRRVWNRVHSA
jgi:hypothetical protein